MKSSVYIETSVVSYYTARPSRDLVSAGHQQTTIDWWDNALPKFRPFVSPFVIEECSKGDAKAAKLRNEAIQKFEILTVNDEIRKLGDQYFKKTMIPEKAKLDAMHLAVAVFHGMDYIASWNFTHILNPILHKVIIEINKDRGLETPFILTPEELMEG